MQQAIREDMAAIGVGGELDLVDRQEIDIDVPRHGLDGRDPVARTLGLDLFLARDERDIARADAGHDPIVHFACEQPQRQADHPALVTEHALDGEMGLARVGRAEDGRHIADAGLKRHIHSWRTSRAMGRHRRAVFGNQAMNSANSRNIPALWWAGNGLLAPPHLLKRAAPCFRSRRAKAMPAYGT